MCAEATLHSWTKVFNSPNPHIGRDHRVQHHSGICELGAFRGVSSRASGAFLFTFIRFEMCLTWRLDSPSNPYPGPRSVLVLDNCNIHHAEKVRKLVEDEARAFHLMSIATIYLLTFPLECKLIFLPPYSPDLNPIEQAFSSIKSYLRRYWQDQMFSIMDCACQNINSEKAWAFFRASGYVA
jgi:hypothetical protein